MLRRVLATVLMIVGAVGASACGDDTSTIEPEYRMRRWVRLAWPVAPVVDGDALVVGERLSGRIRGIDRDGTVEETPRAAVDVVGRADDQRGLLGLVRLTDGRFVAAWTRAPDGRLVVGLVGPLGSTPQLLWVGPESADRANGGGLAVAADGRVLIGVGDLLADRTLDRDRAVPNRKILALDPAGPSDQVPEIVSTGWNNPFAIVVRPNGDAWVADNAGGRARERVGRADRPASDARPLGGRGETRAPAALVDLGRDRLGVCGYVSKRVDEVRIDRGRARLTGRTTARPCAEGAAVLDDGRLVTLTDRAVWISRSRRTGE